MVMLVVVVATAYAEQCHIDIHGSWSLQTVNDLMLLRGNKNASKTDFSDDGKGGKTVFSNAQYFRFQSSLAPAVP